MPHRITYEGIINALHADQLLFASYDAPTSKWPCSEISMCVKFTPDVQNSLMTEDGSHILAFRGAVSDRATYVSLQHSAQDRFGSPFSPLTLRGALFPGFSRPVCETLLTST